MDAQRLHGLTVETGAGSIPAAPIDIMEDRLAKKYNVNEEVYIGGIRHEHIPTYCGVDGAPSVYIPVPEGYAAYGSLNAPGYIVLPDNLDPAYYG